MTVYKIYEEYEELSNSSDSRELVAFTNDKKTYKEYMAVREKKKFVIDKCDMDESEYRRFANKNRLQMIEYRELCTIDRDRFTFSMCTVPLTAYQYSTISEEEGYFGQRGGQIICSKIFKKKYREALDKLQYYIIWQIANAIEPDDNPSFIFDEIAIYVHLFKDDFK